MGAKPTTIGGGKSTGVANDFATQLQNWLSQGFGAVPGGQQTAGDNLGRSNPMGQVSNLSQAFSALLNGGGNMAGSAQQLYDVQRKRAVGDLRSRYALGGTGYGTPAAAGEANYLAEADPQFALGQGKLQMDGISQALQMLMPMFGQQAGLGTPQAQTVMKPSGFTNFLSGLGQAAGIAAQFFPGGNPLGGGSNAGTTPNAPQRGNMTQSMDGGSRYNGSFFG